MEILELEKAESMPRFVPRSKSVAKRAIRTRSGLCTDGAHHGRPVRHPSLTKHVQLRLARVAIWRQEVRRRLHRCQRGHGTGALPPRSQRHAEVILVLVGLAAVVVESTVVSCRCYRDGRRRRLVVDAGGPLCQGSDGGGGWARRGGRRGGRGGGLRGFRPIWGRWG